MKNPIRPLAIACCIPLLGCMMLPFVASAQGAAAVDEKQEGPMLRILCVNSTTENEVVIVASKTEDGKWIEHGPVTLRSSLITPWVKAGTGPLHLVRREGAELVSICSFKIAENSKRSVVVLLPMADKKSYQASVVNPEKLGFRKGMALVTNFSRLPALVMLGSKKMEVMPGKQMTGQAAADENGMYRMLVGYQDEKKQLVPCYDRYVPANPDARDFLMLFPDTTTGLKVYSLSEFGPFE